MRPCATWASRSVHPDQAGPRLRDVGFEIVPPLSASNEALAEVPLVLLILFTIVSLAWSLYDSAPAGERLTPSVV